MMSDRGPNAMSKLSRYWRRTCAGAAAAAPCDDDADAAAMGAAVAAPGSGVSAHFFASFGHSALCPPSIQCKAWQSRLQ